MGAIVLFLGSIAVFLALATERKTVNQKSPGWLWGLGAIAVLAFANLFKGDSVGTYSKRERFIPGSPEQVALFREAAINAGLPEQWASSDGLINILKRESNGWVGIPNFTYGKKSKDRSLWELVWSELRQNRFTAKSTATGLGQLLTTNVDKYYPSKREGIGVAIEEAIGMLRYIHDRYHDPDNAWKLYGTKFKGY